ncbi:MAG: hypothetical protein ACR2NL_08350 [Acidimicrobiia bacterium]
MSIDMESQVRAYADFLDSTLPVLEAQDAMVELIGDPPVQPVQERPVRPIELRPKPLKLASPRRSSRTVAAAVMIGLLIGGVVWLTRDSPGNDVIDQPTVTSIPTPTTPPTTLAESTSTTLGELVLIPGTWSRVPHDETVFGGPSRQGMSSVTVGGPGLVAVGSDGPDGAVWTSVDGVVWSRVPHDQAIFDRAQMSSVTAWGPGLVAVGGSDDGAAVWASVDGVVWSRVDHDESVFGGASMKSVTVGGPGLVAVGWDTTLDTHRADAAVWTSVDGLVWSRVPHDESVFGGDDRQVMYDVTAGGPGLVAVGADGDEPWDNSLGQDAAVWTSVDGIVWSRVPHDESVFGGNTPAMFSVTAGGPGLVAVGFSGYSAGLDPAAVWTSVDGIVWSRVPGPVGNRTFLDVTVAGSGLVAVGFGAEVWTSPDGVNWSRVPENGKGFDGEGDVRMTSVTFHDSRLVVVGYDSSPGGDAAVSTMTD